MKRVVSILVFVIICCFTVSLAGCKKAIQKVEPTTPAKSTQETYTDAGNWTLPVILNGKKNSLNEKVELKELLKDPKIKLVAVTYWATWGEPGNELLHYLNDIFLTYQSKGLMVLAISIDQNEDLQPKIINSILGMKWNKTYKKHKKGDFVHASYPILWDTKNVYREIYNAGAIPFTFLVDKNNKIVYRQAGISEELITDLEAKVKEWLK
jgi:hypothetical protein